MANNTDAALQWFDMQAAVGFFRIMRYGESTPRFRAGEDGSMSKEDLRGQLLQAIALMPPGRYTLEVQTTKDSSKNKTVYDFENGSAGAAQQVAGPVVTAADVEKQVKLALETYKREEELKALKEKLKQSEKELEKAKEEAKKGASMGKLAKVAGYFLSSRDDSKAKMLGAILLSETKEGDSVGAVSLKKTITEPDDEPDDDSDDEDMEERFEDVLIRLEEAGLNDDQVITSNEALLCLVTKIGPDRSVKLVEKIGSWTKEQIEGALPMLGV